MQKFVDLNVCDFLADTYEPLHSLDREAILDEIELYMKKVDIHANP